MSLPVRHEVQALVRIHPVSDRFAHSFVPGPGNGLVCPVLSSRARARRRNHQVPRVPLPDVGVTFIREPYMLTVRIQAIDGTRTFTLLDSQPCRLLILPSCYSSYGALNFYPGGTFTHCSCQPSLDAHFSGRILNSGDPRTECAVVLGAQCWSRRACYEKRDLHIESRALRSGPLPKASPAGVVS